MSEKLIAQLNAVESKLGEEAGKIQKLVKRGKNKSKYYAKILAEVGGWFPGEPRWLNKGVYFTSYWVPLYIVLAVLLN